MDAAVLLMVEGLDERAALESGLPREARRAEQAGLGLTTAWRASAARDRRLTPPASRTDASLWATQITAMSGRCGPAATYKLTYSHYQVASNADCDLQHSSPET